MLGYPTPPEKPVPHTLKSENQAPYGWRHVTCDGSVANLEAIWAARNLKFYPLSLKLAITKTDGNLRFLKDVKYEIETCDGTMKSLLDCSP
ncbi:uncharacterized protein BDW70DRAFT_164914 [Aspergillus foveolatus]|uniref:uncharacterized protein n=1 Tax=Aspergillus foveolatus TaxID=210207 RepID=UPI003CCE3FB2